MEQDDDTLCPSDIITGNIYTHTHSLSGQHKATANELIMGKVLITDHVDASLALKLAIRPIRISPLRGFPFVVAKGGRCGN